jgi:hypothetical protein
MLQALCSYCSAPLRYSPLTISALLDPTLSLALTVCASIRCDNGPELTSRHFSEVVCGKEV